MATSINSNHDKDLTGSAVSSEMSARMKEYMIRTRDQYVKNLKASESLDEIPNGVLVGKVVKQR